MSIISSYEIKSNLAKSVDPIECVIFILLEISFVLLVTALTRPQFYSLLELIVKNDVLWFIYDKLIAGWSGRNLTKFVKQPL